MLESDRCYEEDKNIYKGKSSLWHYFIPSCQGCKQGVILRDVQEEREVPGEIPGEMCAWQRELELQRT